MFTFILAGLVTATAIAKESKVTDRSPASTGLCASVRDDGFLLTLYAGQPAIPDVSPAVQRTQFIARGARVTELDKEIYTGLCGLTHLTLETETPLSLTGFPNVKKMMFFFPIDRDPSVGLRVGDVFDVTKNPDQLILHHPRKRGH